MLREQSTSKEMKKHSKRTLLKILIGSVVFCYNRSKQFSFIKTDAQRTKQVNSKFFRKIDVKKLMRLLLRLRKYSTDCYNLNYVFIKTLSASVSPVPTMRFNNCFEEGSFPKFFKMAYIIPLHKEGDKSNTENYKPISLLPIISQIFELLIFDKIRNYTEKFKILIFTNLGSVQTTSLLTQLFHCRKISE